MYKKIYIIVDGLNIKEPYIILCKLFKYFKQLSKLFLYSLTSNEISELGRTFQNNILSQLSSFSLIKCEWTSSSSSIFSDGFFYKKRISLTELYIDNIDTTDSMNNLNNGFTKGNLPSLQLLVLNSIYFN